MLKAAFPIYQVHVQLCFFFKNLMKVFIPLCLSRRGYNEVIIIATGIISIPNYILIKVYFYNWKRNEFIMKMSNTHTCLSMAYNINIFK